ERELCERELCERELCERESCVRARARECVRGRERDRACVIPCAQTFPLLQQKLNTPLVSAPLSLSLSLSVSLSLSHLSISSSISKISTPTIPACGSVEAAFH